MQYVDDFGGCKADSVRFTHPFHWILRFELFGDVFIFGKLTDNQIVHFVRLRLNVGKICRELTRGEQIKIKAIPHNSGVRIAKSDFSSECSNNQFAY